MSDDRFSVTQKELSDLLKLPRKTILEFERDGMPFAGQGRGKRYNLGDVFTWLRERWDTGSAVPSEALERWRLARAKQAEHQLAVQEGNFLKVDEVAAFWTDRVVEARTALMSLGPGMAPQLVGLDAQAIRRALDGRLRAVCENLARQFEDSLEDARDIDP